MSDSKQLPKVLKAYRQGEEDRAAGISKAPPKHDPFRTAYLNGYYQQAQKRAG